MENRSILSKLLRIIGLSTKREVDILQFQVDELIRWNKKLINRIYEYDEAIKQFQQGLINTIPQGNSIPVQMDTDDVIDTEFEIDGEYGVDFNNIGEA